jgi:hypothetical protein
LEADGGCTRRQLADHRAARPRGFAVVVKPDPGLILRLALFTPMTLDRYAHDLPFTTEYREEE